MLVVESFFHALPLLGSTFHPSRASLRRRRLGRRKRIGSVAPLAGGHHFLAGRWFRSYHSNHGRNQVSSKVEEASTQE